MASNSLANGSPSTSRIESLPCLIRHNQVKQDRPSILYGQLKAMLGNTLLEAYAVYQTSFPPFKNDTRDKAVVQPFLESYANKRLIERAGPSLRELSEEAIIAMWKFQTEIVAPIVELFAQWTLANLSSKVENYGYTLCWPLDGDGPDASSLEIALSAMERMRILRGMYRFQLYCHIFGSQGRSRPRFGEDPFVSMDDVVGLFCNIFEPWELEEFWRIQAYVHHKCEGISVTDHVVDGTASRGLRPLYAISFVGGDHANRIRVMHEVLAWPTIEYLNLSYGSTGLQWSHRKNYPSERDLNEFRREPLPFNGDGESDEFNLRPLAAWVILWKGKYSNIRFIDWELLIWGYVMWDKDRIDFTGAEEITFSFRLEFLPLGNLDYSSPEEEEEELLEEDLEWSDSDESLEWSDSDES
ncbi:hypothetical protein V8C42DRAFT_352943 [Trichoderma barbatum]